MGRRSWGGGGGSERGEHSRGKEIMTSGPSACLPRGHTCLRASFPTLAASWSSGGGCGSWLSVDAP